MAKVKVKDEKSLETAKRKTLGQVDFRKTTKWGVVAAKSRRPKKKLRII